MVSRRADALLDHYVSMMEQFGTLCPDCEVGEPHVCPLRFKSDMAQERLRLQGARLMADPSRG